MKEEAARHGQHIWYFHVLGRIAGYRDNGNHDVQTVKHDSLHKQTDAAVCDTTRSMNADGHLERQCWTDPCIQVVRGRPRSIPTFESPLVHFVSSSAERAPRRASCWARSEFIWLGEYLREAFFHLASFHLNAEGFLMRCVTLAVQSSGIRLLVLPPCILEGHSEGLMVSLSAVQRRSLFFNVWSRWPASAQEKPRNWFCAQGPSIHI